MISNTLENRNTNNEDNKYINLFLLGGKILQIKQSGLELRQQLTLKKKKFSYESVGSNKKWLISHIVHH